MMRGKCMEKLKEIKDEMPEEIESVEIGGYCTIIYCSDRAEGATLQAVEEFVKKFDGKIDRVSGSIVLGKSTSF